jgi:hypothetical protein
LVVAAARSAGLPARAQGTPGRVHALGTELGALGVAAAGVVYARLDPVLGHALVASAGLLLGLRCAGWIGLFELAPRVPTWNAVLGKPGPGAKVVVATALDRVMGARGGGWLALVGILAALVASGSERTGVALAALGATGVLAAAMGLPLGSAAPTAGTDAGSAAAEGRSAGEVVTAVAACPVGAGVVGVVSGCGAAGADGVIAVTGWWRMEGAQFVAYRAPALARALAARGMRVVEAGDPEALAAAVGSARAQGAA